MDKLPVEILCKIFNLLDGRSYINIGSVCKKFHMVRQSIQNDNWIYKVNIDGQNQYTPQLSIIPKHVSVVVQNIDLFVYIYDFFTFLKTQPLQKNPTLTYYHKISKYNVNIIYSFCNIRDYFQIQLFSDIDFCCEETNNGGCILFKYIADKKYLKMQDCTAMSHLFSTFHKFTNECFTPPILTGLFVQLLEKRTNFNYLFIYLDIHLNRNLIIDNFKKITHIQTLHVRFYSANDETFYVNIDIYRQLDILYTTLYGKNIVQNLIFELTYNIFNGYLIGITLFRICSNLQLKKLQTSIYFFLTLSPDSQYINYSLDELIITSDNSITGICFNEIIQKYTFINLEKLTIVNLKRNCKDINFNTLIDDLLIMAPKLKQLCLPKINFENINTYDLTIIENVEYLNYD